MCVTCDYTTYEKIKVPVKDKFQEHLEQSLGYGSLVIRCDTNGKNYRLAVKNEQNSEFKLYACPTCTKRFDVR